MASCLTPKTGPYKCPAGGLDRPVGYRGFVVAADTSRYPFVWGRPYEITHQLPPTWATWTAGPNGGLQLPSGRLVVCGSYVAVSPNHTHTEGSALILSDNG